MAPPSTRDIIRYKEVRRADALDDQKTALQVLAAELQAKTQEQLQEYVLSQVKRIIYGDSPGTWKGDFRAAGIPSLADLAPLANDRVRLCNCLGTDAVDALVYVSGPAVSGRPTVTTSDPTDITTMPVIGIIISKPTPTTCYVQTSGDVPFPGLVEGKRYFVGSNGQPALAPPTPGVGSYAVAQAIGFAVDGSTLTLVPTTFMVKRIG